MTSIEKSFLQLAWEHPTRNKIIKCLIANLLFFSVMFVGGILKSLVVAGLALTLADISLWLAVFLGGNLTTSVGIAKGSTRAQEARGACIASVLITVSLWPILGLSWRVLVAMACLVLGSMSDDVSDFTPKRRVEA